MVTGVKPVTIFISTMKRKKNFHFQGVQFNRLDLGVFLCGFTLFVFGVLAFSVEYAAFTGAAFLVGWLAGKSR